ncbi:hypothetical protein V6Z11_A05G006500 [Gossypium hirsutum]
MNWTFLPYFYRTAIVYFHAQLSKRHSNNSTTTT